MSAMKLAFRNVRRQKKRSIMLGMAMGFGVLVITLVNSLTAGLASSIERNVAEVAGGHVYVTGEVVNDSRRPIMLINDTDTAIAAVESLGKSVDRVNFRSWAMASMSFAGSSEVVSLQGLELESEQSLFDSLKLVEGSFDALQQGDGLVMPATIVEDLGAALGDTLLVSAKTPSGQANLLDWQIVAIFDDSVNIMNQGAAFALRGDVNDLLDLNPNEFQQMNIRLKDMAEMDDATAALQDYFAQNASLKPEPEEEVDPMKAMMAMMLGGLKDKVDEPWPGTQFEVTNLNESMESVNQIIKTVNTVGLVMFVVMMLIIMVGITNSYRMVVIERIQEIGTLRAMGAQRNWVFSLFLSEAIAIALIGSAIGISLSLIASWLIASISFDTGGVMGIFTVAGHLQLPLSLTNFLVPTVITALISAMAVFMPARSAARLDPAEALRSAA